MSEASYATAPYSEEKLHEEDFCETLKGVFVSKNDSNNVKNEYGAWSTLLLDRVDEMIENLSSLKISRKNIRPLKHVRHKALFEFSTM